VSHEPRRRHPSRLVILDRALEALPLFRLSDSVDDSSITFAPPGSGRWRVLPATGDRVPGTFDQDVFVELFHRYHDAGAPPDGAVSFTLHAFLRSMGRRVDGRTYEQLRSALNRLLRTTLESSGAYELAGGGTLDGRLTVLTSIAIDRRRTTDREQLSLFSSLSVSEPGDARVTFSPLIVANVAGGFTTTVPLAQYLALSSPVARRLYRLLAVVRAAGEGRWQLPLEQLAEQLPLAQRYPSHLQRVLQPAHEMLIHGGVLASAEIRRETRSWLVDYMLATPAG
jgi:plasmid replication initiation protein